MVFVFFGEVGKLAGKSASTEPKNVRKTRIIFGEMNKYEAIARILAGKSSGTKQKDMRKTPNNIRDNKQRKRIRISFIKHPITQVVSKTS